MGDLDQYKSVAEFIMALSVPTLDANMVRTQTSEKEKIEVNLADMSILVNGHPEHEWSNKLYADLGFLAIGIKVR